MNEITPVFTSIRVIWWLTRVVEGKLLCPAAVRCLFMSHNLHVITGAYMLLLKLIKIFVFAVHMCEKIQGRIPILIQAYASYSVAYVLLLNCWAACTCSVKVLWKSAAKQPPALLIQQLLWPLRSVSCPYLLLHHVDKTNEQCELQLNVRSVRPSALDQKSFLDLSLQVLEVLTEKIRRPNGLILLNWHNIFVKPRIS